MAKYEPKRALISLSVKIFWHEDSLKAREVFLRKLQNTTSVILIISRHIFENKYTPNIFCHHKHTILPPGEGVL